MALMTFTANNVSNATFNLNDECAMKVSNALDNVLAAIMGGTLPGTCDILSIYYKGNVNAGPNYF
jgi:hypothetical protein